MGLWPNLGQWDGEGRFAGKLLEKFSLLRRRPKKRWLPSVCGLCCVHISLEELLPPHLLKLRKGSLHAEPTTENGRVERDGTWAHGDVAEPLNRPPLLSVISRLAAVLDNESLDEFSW